MEPVVIDHLPIRLTKAQQKLWDSGDSGKRDIRAAVRQGRLDAQIPEHEMTPAPTFNEVMGE